MKKSIKQKIFEKLDKDGYITDQDLAIIYEKEPNFMTAEGYKDQWKRLQHNRRYFEGMDIRYVERYKGLKASADDKHWYRMSPDYWNEIKDKFTRDFNYRPDLKIERYEKRN
jgi:hypothetical protein